MGWFTFGGLAGFAAGPPVTAVVLGGLGLGATPLLALPALVMAAVTATRRAPAPPGSAGGPVPTTAARPTGGPPPVRLADHRDHDEVGALLRRERVPRALPRRAARRAAAGRRPRADRLHHGPAPSPPWPAAASPPASGGPGTLLASYVAGALALGVLLATTSPALAVVVSGLLGVALGVPVPVHTTLGQSYLPRHLGLASAVTLGLSVSAGGLASPALGALADRHGITAAMLVLLAFPALAAVFSVPLLARRPRPS